MKEPPADPGEGPKGQVLPPSLTTLIEADAVCRIGRVKWQPIDRLVEQLAGVVVLMGTVHLVFIHEIVVSEPVMSHGRLYATTCASNLRA
jgi:hypothetical protein